MIGNSLALNKYAKELMTCLSSMLIKLMFKFRLATRIRESFKQTQSGKENQG